MLIREDKILDQDGFVQEPVWGARQKLRRTTYSRVSMVENKAAQSKTRSCAEVVENFSLRTQTAYCPNSHPVSGKEAQISLWALPRPFKSRFGTFLAVASIMEYLE
jgi:hypothetical protein